MVDLAVAMNRTFEFTCPKCGSHNVKIDWNNYDHWFVVTCAICGHESLHTYPELMYRLHNHWGIRVKPLEKHDDQDRVITEQVVVRTYTKQLAYKVKSRDESFKNLNTLLLKGWHIVTSDSLGDEIIYILEKEVEE